MGFKMVQSYVGISISDNSFKETNKQPGLPMTKIIILPIYDHNVAE